MRTPSQPSSQASQSWEHFAERDPYSYILTSLKGGDKAEFWRTGEQTIETDILPMLHQYAGRPRLGLELGCGIGRLVGPLARRFQEVVGVDIAPGMILRAAAFARDNGIKNVSFLSISGPEDLLHQAGNYAEGCDFIYSLLVFQHIPDFLMIEGYLHVIRILLHPQGLAYLQFDTRPASAAYRL